MLRLSIISISILLCTAIAEGQGTVTNSRLINGANSNPGSEASQTVTGTDATAVNVVSTARAHIFDQSTFALEPTASGYGSQFGSYRTLTTYGPGLSLGNAGGWRTTTNTYLSGLYAARGITQGLSMTLTKHAVGDIANYFYSYSDEGRTAESDEGHEFLALNGGETTGYYRGTINSTTGTGDAEPFLSVATGGNNWTTDGNPLLDITKGTISGSYSGSSKQLGTTYLKELPVSNTLPLTTAWGQLTHAIANPSIPPNQSATLTVDVKLNNIGANTPSFSIGHACIAGPNYPEQTAITAVTTATIGVQSITFSYKNPNGAPGKASTYPIIFQGGICGQYISEDANLAYSGYRTSYYAFGSLTGSDLIYGVNLAGSLLPQELPMISEAQTATSGYHLYPGAEIVANRTTGAAPTLETNEVPWAAADVVENPHNVSANVSALHIDLTQNTPANNQNSYEAYATVHGYGVASQSFLGDYLINANPPTYYTDFGGPVATPLCNKCADGYWTYPFFAKYGPAVGGAVVAIGGTEKGDRTAYTIFQQRYGTGADNIITYSPATSTVGVRNLTVGGQPVCLANGTGCRTVQGVATLASGTVTVPTTAACATTSKCVYKFTNCGANSSTAIGTLSLGTVSVGTSFAINSLSAEAAPVAGDASTVCWAID